MHCHDIGMGRAAGSPTWLRMMGPAALERHSRSSLASCASPVTLHVGASVSPFVSREHGARASCHSESSPHRREVAPLGILVTATILPEEILASKSGARNMAEQGNVAGPAAESGAAAGNGAA